MGFRVKWGRYLEPLTRAGWFWDNDGVLRKIQAGLAHLTPWRHSPTPIPGQTQDCKYLQLVAKAIRDHAPGSTAQPAFCMDCYKVVMKLRSLGDVAVVELWQQFGEASEWACKVGADMRNYTGSHWGAYFYCRGMEAGQRRLKQVEQWRDANLPGVEVFLKRGCTEYERDTGPSSRWESDPIADEIEREAGMFIDPGPIIHNQPDVLADSVHSRWHDWNRDLSRTLNYDRYDPLSVANRELMKYTEDDENAHGEESPVFEFDGELFELDDDSAGSIG
jgi:hypothetical protein